MQRIFKQLERMRCKIHSLCMSNERGKNWVYNVVNCRAYYILLNALDNEIYCQLTYAFDLPPRHWYPEIFEFKVHQLYSCNHSNKFKLKKEVLEEVLNHLRILKHMYRPNAKEIAQFVRWCDSRQIAYEDIWKRLTGKELFINSSSCQICLDNYLPHHKKRFQNLIFHTFEKDMLWQFFVFDYEHYILSEQMLRKIMAWLLEKKSLDLASFQPEFCAVLDAPDWPTCLIRLHEFYRDNNKKHCYKFNFKRPAGRHSR